MNVVLVNTEKENRAKAIIALVKSGRIAPNRVDEERRLKWIEIFKSEKIDLEKEEQSKLVVFVYKKLGGLVRTPQEQAEVDAQAKKAKRGRQKER